MRKTYKYFLLCKYEMTPKNTEKARADISSLSVVFQDFPGGKSAIECKDGKGESNGIHIAGSFVLNQEINVSKNLGLVDGKQINAIGILYLLHYVSSLKIMPAKTPSKNQPINQFMPFSLIPGGIECA